MRYFCMQNQKRRPAGGAFRVPMRLSAIEVLDLLGSRRVAELADGLILDLADTLARDAEDLADLLERMRPAVVHAEAHPQDVRLALGQRAENLRQGLRQQRIGGRIGRRRQAG